MMTFGVAERHSGYFPETLRKTWPRVRQSLCHLSDMVAGKVVSRMMWKLSLWCHGFGEHDEARRRDQGGHRCGRRGKCLPSADLRGRTRTDFGREATVRAADE